MREEKYSMHWVFEALFVSICVFVFVFCHKIIANWHCCHLSVCLCMCLSRSLPSPEGKLLENIWKRVGLGCHACTRKKGINKVMRNLSFYSLLASSEDIYAIIVFYVTFHELPCMHIERMHKFLQGSICKMQNYALQFDRAIQRSVVLWAIFFLYPQYFQKFSNQSVPSWGLAKIVVRRSSLTRW